LTDQQISEIVNMLRFKNEITPLQKDILDTWNTLHKVPFDAESAHKQITSNNSGHPDIFLSISALPGIVRIPAEMLTQDDMRFTLRRQLDGLVAKEMETHIK
jgi:hypothetical protein